MANPLDNIRVLVIEDDADTSELLAIALTRRGASVRIAGSGAETMSELDRGPVDVLLCDLDLPDGSALDWLATFRTIPGVAVVPAIALSGYARIIDRDHSLAAGFEKHLAKPAQIGDIVAAITNLVRRDNPAALGPMLSRLSVRTGCRFTSLLRFEADYLVSVWTFDRDRPTLDPFPIGLPIAASYCNLVRAANALVAIEDAACDPRAAGHPKQRELPAYVGAPVYSADGTMFGTLCSYDPVAHRIDAIARTEIVAAARQVEAIVRAHAC